MLLIMNTGAGLGLDFDQVFTDKPLSYPTLLQLVVRSFEPAILSVFAVGQVLHVHWNSV